MVSQASKSRSRSKGSRSGMSSGRGDRVVGPERSNSNGRKGRTFHRIGRNGRVDDNGTLVTDSSLSRTRSRGKSRDAPEGGVLRTRSKSVGAEGRDDIGTFHTDLANQKAGSQIRKKGPTAYKGGVKSGEADSTAHSATHSEPGADVAEQTLLKSARTPSPITKPSMNEAQFRSNAMNSTGFSGRMKSATKRKARKGANTAEENSQTEVQVEVLYEKFGENALDVLRVRQYDSIPMVKTSTDVVVKVEASTVTLNDCLIRRGMCETYDSVPLPNTPGFDVVGTIIELGKKARQDGLFRVGDRVAALVRTGGNARYCIVPAHSLNHVPERVNSAEAACLVSTYMTAYQALQIARPIENRQTLNGSSVLVTGGIGPIGQAVIQLARRAGANVVYAIANERQHEAISMLGAEPLPTDPNLWLPIVKGKMDVVIDSVCQDGFESPRAALNMSGSLVCIGMTAILSSSGPGVCGLPGAALWASLKANYLMQRTSYYDVWKNSVGKPDVYKHDLNYLLGLLEKKEIKPNIMDCISLQQVAEAQKMIETGQTIGSLVCLPWKYDLRSRNVSR